jgi:hypothetical protein
MDLSYSRVQDHEFKEFLQHCQKLRNISLANCQTITDATLEHLVDMLPNMTELNISNCQNITNYGINLLLRRAHNLVSLNISRLAIIHPIQPPNRPKYNSFESNNAASKLQNIDVSHTNATDEDIMTLCESFPAVKKVTMRECKDLRFLTTKVLEKIM